MIDIGEHGPVADVRLDARRVSAIIRELCAGNAAVLTSHDRAALVMAASEATTSRMAFFVRQTSGFLAVALPEAVCDSLQFSPMWSSPTATRSSFGVSVDLATGGGTGISAADRGATARACADPEAQAGHFTRPGHLLTVRVATASDNRAPDMATAAMLLAYSATGFAAGLFADLQSESPTRARSSTSEITALAATFSLPVLDLHAAFET
ncbi:hypothetical protein CH267_06585 [Rhodococcus sp. 06-621-2]|nr:3,4-dihydroxy-2-butanone-4-phosphate synthase [Rhodococcus sp. 06-621-2]OZC59760.1 hypothetical protein CH267_06585 [Rhodococcus sp. 06-621-2]